MNTKNNRQYQASVERMEQAMLQLIHTVPVKKITVRLICETAGVNRSTFYAHYMDIYDMLEQMEWRLQQQLMQRYPVPGQYTPLSTESFIPFLAFIRSHQEFYRAALRNRREFPIRHGFDALWNQIIRPLCHKAGIEDENEMMYYFVGFQAGFTLILSRWVENGCLESPESLSRIIRNALPAVFRTAAEEGHSLP